MKQKRYVIYSAMVGAYDDILQPKVVDERFDYILFSNEIKEKQIGVWQVRPIAYHNEDNTRICRYVKTHPEELLKEYDVSVWIDSNIQIMTDYLYRRVIKLDEENVLVSALWHPARHCIYAEAFAVLQIRVEFEETIIKWCHKLRKEHYPRENGLSETGITYRKHRDNAVAHLDELWWKSIDNYSRRDQLSFTYAMWKCGIPNVDFIGEVDVRQSEHFQLIVHKDVKHNHCPMKKNEAWLMHHLWVHPKDAKKIENLYFRLYAYPYPAFWIALAGQYFRIKDRRYK